MTRKVPNQLPPLTTEHLDQVFNSIKPMLPADGVVTLFVMRQQSEENPAVNVQFITNGPAMTVAQVLRDWSAGVVSGAIGLNDRP